ncbi:collagen alpha-1(X) chain-like [Mercenaria mercenaria]|uniref:collagen alpha-1(X) chain-like n=1 Tax=Mercenaria mercenaria TaxID=6596 RepID=UPI00234F9D6D|nr:collagen alpha-1(X) chain-like [Mercenaria mercenaria]
MLRHFMLFNFVFLSIKCEEPHCSRFHYEDQLLDKMIRLEIKVEAMEKEILNTNKQALESLRELKDVKDNFQRDYVDVKNNIQTDFKELKQNILEDINTVKEKVLTPTILFKARQPADVSLETGQIIVFNKIMTNRGGAYDNVTGIFTVPIAGTYLFTSHLCVFGKKTFYYGIVVDNIIETSGRFYEDYSETCHTADAMLVLEAGQKVWMKCVAGQTNNVLYEYNSSSYMYWNTFSGMLVHK